MSIGCARGVILPVIFPPGKRFLALCGMRMAMCTRKSSSFFDSRLFLGIIVNGVFLVTKDNRNGMHFQQVCASGRLTEGPAYGILVPLSGRTS
jgi:hypothetical protein